MHGWASATAWEVARRTAIDYRTTYSRLHVVARRRRNPLRDMIVTRGISNIDDLTRLSAHAGNALTNGNSESIRKSHRHQRPNFPRRVVADIHRAPICCKSFLRFFDNLAARLQKGNRNARDIRRSCRYNASTAIDQRAYHLNERGERAVLACPAIQLLLVVDCCCDSHQ